MTTDSGTNRRFLQKVSFTLFGIPISSVIYMSPYMYLYNGFHSCLITFYCLQLLNCREFGHLVLSCIHRYVKACPAPRQNQTIVVLSFLPHNQIISYLSGTLHSTETISILPIRVYTQVALYPRRYLYTVFGLLLP